MRRVALITDAPFCKDVRAQRTQHALTECGYDVGVFDQGFEIADTRRMIPASAHYPSTIPPSGISKTWWHFKNRVLALPTYRARTQARICDLQLFDPSVIWCINVFDLEAATKVAQNKNIPFIYEAYEYWPEHLTSAEYGLPLNLAHHLQTVECTSAPFITRFVTVSSALGKWYQDQCEMPKADIVLNAHIPLKQAGIVNVQEDKVLRIVHSGQVAKNRNIEPALEAMQHIKDAHLTIQGAGPDFDRLKASSITQKTDSISFVQAVPHAEMHKVLQDHDIGLILTDGSTQQTDGALPNKLFDYMSSGLAVIAVRTTALESFHNIDSFALLIDEPTPEAIANAIDEMSSHPEMVSKMKVAARRESENYHENAIQETIQKVIALADKQSVARNKKPRREIPLKEHVTDRADSSTVPFISILVPAFNARETIRQTIGSVLMQEEVSFELIIVDDGSTDDTVETVEAAIAGDERAKLICQENQGTGGALATAADNAQGEWLLMIGADDYLTDGALAKRVAFMDGHPGYDIYSADYFYTYDDGKLRQAPDWGEVRSITLEELLTFPHIAGNSLFHRSDLERIGGFRSQFFNEDYDLWLRLLAHGATHIHQPEPLQHYRIHEGQKTTDAIKLRTDDMAILDDLIQSGLLSDTQVEIARAMIEKYRRNTRIRERLYSVIGKRTTELLIEMLRR